MMGENSIGSVRKGWNTGFFSSPDSIFDRADVSALGKLVYLYLCRRADSDGQSYPGHVTMANDIGIGKTTVKDRIRELEEKGLLTVEHRYNELTREYSTNLYTLHHPNESVQMGGSSRDLPLGQHQTEGGSSRDLPLGRDTTIKEHTYLRNTHIKVNNNRERSNQEQLPSQNNVVVDPIKSLLMQHKIKINNATIQKWRQLSDDVTIQTTVEYALQNPAVKNVIGYVTNILRDGFVPLVQPERNRIKDQKVSDYIERLKQAGL